MQIGTQRAVDRWIGVPLCALLSLVNRLLPPPPAPPAPRRILIILLSEMGSLVLAYPMFRWLKERYPDASLHMLMFAKNRQALDLLDVIPPQNVLTLDDSTFGNFARESAAMVSRLRAMRFDVTIDCELFARISSVFSFLSNAPVRVGFHRLTQEGLYRGSFINRRVGYNPYRHLTLQLLSLAGAIESTSTPVAKFPIVPPRLTPPRIVASPQELEAMQARLGQDHPGTAGRRLVLMYPGGGILPTRAWPPDSYRALCRALLAEGYAIGITGLKEDRPLAQDLVLSCGSPACVDLTGYTRDVRELLTLYQCAALLITNDGAPGQFSALVGIRTIVFFGPETPLLYGPLGDDAFSFFIGLPCSPCLTAYNHRRSPCDGDNQCLKRITVEEVLSKAREMLAEPPPATALHGEPA
ncbi:MAG TPA: glycosyltransferase family 9 protein [Burkholderiaceae bacterium]|nr:glycosyltransferase family 9 protein [Burkholderiaceae bacterium]